MTGKYGLNWQDMTLSFSMYSITKCSTRGKTNHPNMGEARKYNRPQRI